MRLCTVLSDACNLDAEEAAPQGRLVGMEPGSLIIGDPRGDAWREAVDGVKGAQQLIGAPQLLKHLQLRRPLEQCPSLYTSKGIAR